MYSSTQLTLVSVLVLIAFIRNDVNNNNNMNSPESWSFFCHGFTTTRRQQSLRPNTRATGSFMVQQNQQQPYSLKNDIHYHNTNDGDDDRRIMDTDTTARCAAVPTLSRRDLMAKMMVLTTTTVMMYSTSATLPAFASGGATAGRYTTIPIAKRRYYGRVQQAVHEFLEMGTLIVKGDLSNPIVSTFFDVNGIVVVEAKRKDVNGQCTKKDNECKGREIRDSRWNDMKASMYLLGNAFRTDQQKPPDRLPTVKAARAFFKEMNEMEKIVKANKKMSAANADAVQKMYTNALVVLDAYLDLVELPPTNSGHYDKEFDTLVGETARIT